VAAADGIPNYRVPFIFSISASQMKSPEKKKRKSNTQASIALTVHVCMSNVSSACLCTIQITDLDLPPNHLADKAPLSCVNISFSYPCRRLGFPTCLSSPRLPPLWWTTWWPPTHLTMILDPHLDPPEQALRAALPFCPAQGHQEVVGMAAGWVEEWPSWGGRLDRVAGSPGGGRLSALHPTPDLITN